MTRCTTWHVRIDLVDDGADLAGRIEFIGAPASMSALLGGDIAAEDETESDLATWRPVEHLADALLMALTQAHRVPTH